MTNSKYIRSMTDKELARFIGGIAECCGCPLAVCTESEHCVENLVKFLGNEADPARYDWILLPDKEVE